MSAIKQQNGERRQASYTTNATIPRIMLRRAACLLVQEELNELGQKGRHHGHADEDVETSEQLRHRLVSAQVPVAHGRQGNWKARKRLRQHNTGLTGRVRVRVIGVVIMCSFRSLDLAGWVGSGLDSVWSVESPWFLRDTSAPAETTWGIKKKPMRGDTYRFGNSDVKCVVWADQQLQ